MSASYSHCIALSPLKGLLHQGALLIAIAYLLSAPTAEAMVQEVYAPVNTTWDASPDAVASYVVKWGFASKNYRHSAETTDLFYTFRNLEEGRTVYAIIQARGPGGALSSASNELVFRVLRADADEDNVHDSFDNCRGHANPGQSDLDADGLGDACDPDADGDSIANAADNCPLLSNPTQFDADQDGQGDACDIDADNDGLDLETELQIGTDPLRADTDGDGVSDAQELADSNSLSNSNPLDAGSRYPGVSRDSFTDLYFGVNRFLGHWNVMELLYVPAAGSAVVSVGVENQAGNYAVERQFRLSAENPQFDVLLHDLGGGLGFPHDQIGTARVAVLDGTATDVRPTYLIYRPSTRTPGSFDYVWESTATVPTRGLRVLFNNTFFPSIRPQDADNVVAVIARLRHESSTAEVFEFRFRAQDGSLLRSLQYLIPGIQEYNVLLHEPLLEAAAGLRTVGTVEVEALNSDRPFTLDSVRYYGSAPEWNGALEAALRLPGVHPTGEAVVAPFSTESEIAVLEVANALPRGSRLQVRIHSGTEAPRELSLQLDAGASTHIILNEHVTDARGWLEVLPESSERIVAQVMQYSQTRDGALQYVYSFLCRQPLGERLLTSYNSFLTQETSVVLINRGAEAQSARLRVRSAAGAALLDEEIEIPALHTEVRNLSNRIPSDSYGRLELQLAERNSLVAWSLRSRPQQQDYLVVLPMVD